MSRQFPELDQIRVTVGDDLRNRQLAAIGDAIRSARRPGIRRFRLLAIAAALILALPVMALASENSVPGDVLYPIKRMLEPMVSLVNGDVEVDHRVREAEVLLERDAEPAVIRDQVDRARIVVDREHPEHTARLDVIVDELRRREDGGGDGVPAKVDPVDEEAGEAEGRDRPQDHREPETGPSQGTVDGDDRPHETTTTTPDDGTTRPVDARGDG